MRTDRQGIQGALATGRTVPPFLYSELKCELMDSVKKQNIL